MRNSTVFAVAALVGCLACDKPSTTNPEPSSTGGDATATDTGATTDSAARDTEKGGRLFDKTTPEVRLKNIFGWDLRGQEGIYGPSYQAKEGVSAVNLLTDTRSADELVAWLSAGDEEVPALGDALSADELADLAAFIVAVRERELPHPEQVWSLSEAAPKNYELLPGADVEAGAGLIAGKCSGCHGDDGTSILIDEHYTLGAYARTKAYEAWIKIVNGQPGTGMGRQSSDAGEVLNILAALCDRSAFPGKDTEHDAPDGDPRCGDYLR